MSKEAIADNKTKLIWGFSGHMPYALSNEFNAFVYEYGRNDWKRLANRPF